MVSQLPSSSFLCFVVTRNEEKSFLVDQLQARGNSFHLLDIVMQVKYPKKPGKWQVTGKLMHLMEEEK